MKSKFGSRDSTRSLGISRQVRQAHTIHLRPFEVSCSSASRQGPNPVAIASVYNPDKYAEPNSSCFRQGHDFSSRFRSPGEGDESQRTAFPKADEDNCYYSHKRDKDDERRLEDFK